MTERSDADLLEIGVGELGQHLEIDIVVGEGLSILRQSQFPQPFVDFGVRHFIRRLEESRLLLVDGVIKV